MRNLQTQDLFTAARLIKEIGIKEEIKEICQKDKIVKIDFPQNATEEEKQKIIEKYAWDKGFDFVYMIFDKATEKNAEDKVYEFLAGVFEKTAEEVKTGDLIETLEELTSEEDIKAWKDFFTRLAGFLKSK